MNKTVLKKYWWIILIIILLLYVIIVAIVDNCCLNRITEDSLNYINLLITPIGVILGLVLGYPLLRKKLVESYVLKQFNIIDDANRSVRKKCLELLEKYPVRYISKDLTIEYINDLIADIKELKDIAIDANKDVYKYIRLVYDSLIHFQERTKNGIPHGWKISYFCETVSTFAHNHIQRVYDLSSSIVNIPSNDTTKKQLLTKKLRRFVRGNDIYKIDGIDLSLSFYHDSALLVLFFGNNINSLDSNNGLLFECCYRAVPTPSAIARILYNSSIYVPLKLTGNTIMNFATPELVLTGYKREFSTNVSSAIKTDYLVCHYANISNFGFILGMTAKSDFFPEYKDSYLDTDSFNVDDISEFTIDKERLIIKIDERKAIENFTLLKKKLEQKMISETK